jgi:hypothetical protein
MSKEQENNGGKQIVTFLDLVGRTIIGELVTDSDQQKEGFLVVKNPAIMNVVPNPQTNQMALQLFPVFFKEFQADRNEDSIWYYNKNNIVESNNVILDFKLQAQYTNMFSRIIVPDKTIATPNKNNNVVKLFDE